MRSTHARGGAQAGPPRLPLSFQVGGAFSIVDQDGARPGSRVECVRHGCHSAPGCCLPMPGPPARPAGPQQRLWAAARPLAAPCEPGIPPARRSARAAALAGQRGQALSGHAPPAGCSAAPPLPPCPNAAAASPPRPPAALLSCRSPQEEEARRGLGRQEGGRSLQSPADQPAGQRRAALLSPCPAAASRHAPLNSVPPPAAVSAPQAAAAAEAKQKGKAQRKEIFKRAEAYVKEYRAQVRSACVLRVLLAWEQGGLGCGHGSAADKQVGSKESCATAREHAPQQCRWHGGAAAAAAAAAAATHSSRLGRHPADGQYAAQLAADWSQAGWPVRSLANCSHKHGRLNSTSGCKQASVEASCSSAAWHGMQQACRQRAPRGREGRQKLLAGRPNTACTAAMGGNGPLAATGHGMPAHASPRAADSAGSGQQGCPELPVACTLVARPCLGHKCSSADYPRAP